MRSRSEQQSATRQPAIETCLILAWRLDKLCGVATTQVRRAYKYRFTPLTTGCAKEKAPRQRREVPHVPLREVGLSAPEPVRLLCSSTHSGSVTLASALFDYGEDRDFGFLNSFVVPAATVLAHFAEVFLESCREAGPVSPLQVSQEIAGRCGLHPSAFQVAIRTLTLANRRSHWPLCCRAVPEGEFQPLAR